MRASDKHSCDECLDGDECIDGYECLDGDRFSPDLFGVTLPGSISNYNGKKLRPFVAYWGEALSCLCPTK